MYKRERTVELLTRFDKMIDSYKGDITLLEKAIGVYFVGRRVGWKVLYIAHDTKTIRKYEAILGISFRQEFAEFEDQGHRTAAYKALKAVTNFWRAVKGELEDFKRSTMIGR
jgi:hypothetical protein